MTVSNVDNISETALSQEKIELNSTTKAEPSVEANLEKKPVPDKDLDADPNFRAFREGRKQDRIAREAAERKAAEKEAEAQAMKAAMEAAFPQSGNSSHHNNSYQQNGSYEEETEDQRLEKKVQVILAQREEQARVAQHQREIQEFPHRLRQMYPDFDQVVAPENLDYLDYHYQEVAEALSAQPDGFDKWSRIYKNVKKLVPNSTTAKKESARADSNFSKPRSISTNSITQPGDGGGIPRLTEEKRAANWERMQKTLKSVS